MAKRPSTNGGKRRQNRDAHGRFTVGNPGGPGNPLGARVAKLRAELVKAVTPADVRAIARRLVKDAKRGDLNAARLLLGYTLGRPTEADIHERLERLEALALELEGSKTWRGVAG